MNTHRVIPRRGRDQTLFWSLAEAYRDIATPEARELLDGATGVNCDESAAMATLEWVKKAGGDSYHPHPVWMRMLD